MGFNREVPFLGEIEISEDTFVFGLGPFRFGTTVNQEGERGYLAGSDFDSKYLPVGATEDAWVFPSYLYGETTFRGAKPETNIALKDLEEVFGSQLNADLEFTVQLKAKEYHNRSVVDPEQSINSQAQFIVTAKVGGSSINLDGRLVLDVKAFDDLDGHYVNYTEVRAEGDIAQFLDTGLAALSDDWNAIDSGDGFTVYASDPKLYVKQNGELVLAHTTNLETGQLEYVGEAGDTVSVPFPEEVVLPDEFTESIGDPFSDEVYSAAFFAEGPIVETGSEVLENGDKKHHVVVKSNENKSTEAETIVDANTGEVKEKKERDTRETASIVVATERVLNADNIIVGEEKTTFFERVQDGAIEILQEIPFQQVGSFLGSQIGKAIAGDNQFAQIGAGTLLEAIGGNLGAAFDSFLDHNTGFIDALDATFAGKVFDAKSGNWYYPPKVEYDEAGEVISVTQDKSGAFLNGLGTAFKSAGVSYLTNELISSIGFSDSFAGQLGQTALSSGIGFAVNGARLASAAAEAAATLDSLSTALDATTSAIETAKTAKEFAEFQSGLGAQVGLAIAGFIGSYLGSKVYAPKTVEGQIGQSLGAAAGAKIGAKIGFSVGGPIGAFIGAAVGAFFGAVFGGVLGDLFGSPPRAWADLVVDEATGEYVVKNVRSKKGGSKELVRSLAESAASTINGLVDWIGGKIIEGGQRYTFNHKGDKNKVYGSGISRSW